MKIIAREQLQIITGYMRDSPPRVSFCLFLESPPGGASPQDKNSLPPNKGSSETGNNRPPDSWLCFQDFPRKHLGVGWVGAVFPH